MTEREGKAEKPMGKQETSYIFVTGAVVSGLGKGDYGGGARAAAQARGLTVAAQKLDPTSTSTRAR